MTLAAENLSVRREGTEILSGVSARLERGSVTAICGPNGAGKSTLLAALAGLVHTSGGAASLGGKMLAETGFQERARRIGYLPQAGEVAWDLSVRNLVALGRMPHRDRGEAQIAAALKATDMVLLAARPVSTLSGGEKARALLARVLAGEPEWILADEPLAALDIGHQLALLTRLRTAAESGAGVVLVLHDLGLAMNHADRVLILDRGVLVADGPPQQVLSEAIIARVWGVSARWLGEGGERALAPCVS